MAIELRDPASPVAALLAALGEFRVHDASPLIEPGMPMFVTYEGRQITPRFGHAETGVAANRGALGEHTDTHLDAPFQFDPHGPTVDELAPDARLLRPYKKFDLADQDPGPGRLLDAAALTAAAARAGFLLEPGDVAIIEMGWDRHGPGGPGGAARDYGGHNEPWLSEDACRYLARAGVVAVASDTAGRDVPCIDGEIGFGHGHSSWFLPRGILIVGGLRGLDAVAATGLFVALPLNIARGTGSPLRVLLLHRGPGDGV